MAPPVGTGRRSQDDVIASLSDRLRGYFEASGRAATTFVELVRLRNRLAHTHYLETEDHARIYAIVREAEQVVTLRLGEVEKAQRWSVLMREWNTALVEAAERVDRGDDLRSAFAAYAAEETDADRAVGRAAFEAAAAQWRDA